MKILTIFRPGGYRESMGAIFHAPGIETVRAISAFPQMVTGAVFALGEMCAARGKRKGKRSVFFLKCVSFCIRGEVLSQCCHFLLRCLPVEDAILLVREVL